MMIMVTSAGIANNQTNHKRSKHINIKYHFSREQIKKGVSKIIF